MTFSEDIFPKPSKPIHKVFRCCGSCPRCIAKQSQMEDQIRRTSIKLLPEFLFPEEYILICSSGKPPPVFSRRTSNNPLVFYISNYGRPFMMFDHGMGCHGRVEKNIINKCGEESEIAPLTQEFINYYNSIWFYGGQWEHVFKREDSIQMIMEYQKKPNIQIAYKIEKDKREIQEMTSELQKKETEIVNERNHLKSVGEKLLLQEKTLKENERKLNDKINIHKQKSLKLLERENKISVKGSVETILKELLDISLSISEILEVADSPILVNRIDQIIGRLNHIKSTGGSTVHVEREVIVATEVLAEPSAPPPGYYSGSLSS